MINLALLAIIAVGAWAAPTGRPLLEERADAPTVTIKDGTVIGSSKDGVDTFKGIPYAQAPTGSLRLQRPKPLDSSFGTLMATSLPMSCPQFYLSVDTSNLPEDVAALILDSPLVDEITNTGEDCLNLNVQRPSTATSDSKLPVIVWIFGGGFEFGTPQLYPGDHLVNKSIEVDQSVIYVAISYRVGGWGFLAGKELQQEGNTNLGLRDQRLALQWVHDNIAAFGGDPDRVTIWGESAGAISVFDHTIINGGDNNYNGGQLFHAAIMNSGSIVPALEVDSVPAQGIFDTVIRNSACAGNSNPLGCLRGLSLEDFANAVNSAPGIFGPRSLDLSYLPRPDPSDNFFSQSPDISVNNGQYAKVPVIIGDQTDEGTLFALTLFNITTTDEVVDYLATYFPNADRSVVQGLVDTYPDDASAGSPYGTGDKNNFYPQFKRLAAILGDVTFTLTRRLYLSTVSNAVPAWSYISAYFYGLPILGTFHASDLLAAFYGLPNSDVQDSILEYYISFANNLDPNTIGDDTSWPQWKDSNELLAFTLVGNGIASDDFRSDSYSYLADHVEDFRV